MPLDFDLRFVEDEHGVTLRCSSGQLVRLLKIFEDERLEVYRDPVGVLTCGVGHTGERLDGSPLLEGDAITAEESDELLRRDLARYEAGVRRLVRQPIGQNQFDALVSFAFNVGLGALERSTLLALLNRGQYEDAAQEFLKWRMAGGRVLRGLELRRSVEREIFERARYDFTPHDNDLSDAQEYRVAPQRPSSEPRSDIRESRTMSETLRGIAASVTGLLATIGTFFQSLTSTRAEVEASFAGLPQSWVMSIGLTIVGGALLYNVASNLFVRFFRVQDWLDGRR